MENITNKHLPLGIFSYKIYLKPWKTVLNVILCTFSDSIACFFTKMPLSLGPLCPWWLCWDSRAGCSLELKSQDSVASHPSWQDLTVLRHFVTSKLGWNTHWEAWGLAACEASKRLQSITQKCRELAVHGVNFDQWGVSVGEKRWKGVSQVSSLLFLLSMAILRCTWILASGSAF